MIRTRGNTRPKGAEMRLRLIIWTRQTTFYALIVAPLTTLNIWLAGPRSHVAMYIAEGLIIFAGLAAQGPLQRRYWP